MKFLGFEKTETVSEPPTGPTTGDADSNGSACVHDTQSGPVWVLKAPQDSMRAFELEEGPLYVTEEMDEAGIALDEAGESFNFKTRLELRGLASGS